MSKVRHIFTLLAILTSHVVSAQETHAYDKALEAYEFGRFEEVDSLLSNAANELRGENLVNAYRLLALSSLNMDKPDEAEKYVARLLSVDPYYKAYNDAPRFADMVERMKGGKNATIFTASQQAESLEEAPVPVTLITEEMIKMSGARNLKEALIAYVPGMSHIECNEELNLAMRGVYASRQEKILIMLNGHRLNSYSTNAAVPDFSISLEKVKQIEVLRGPASSLYGGVALTGVVNIITKEAAEVDGLQLKLGGGNYGQIKGNMLFGKRYMNLAILAWAHIYQADGQSFSVRADDQPNSVLPADGRITIGGYNKKPTHDLGVTLQWNDLTLTYANTFSKTVAPYTMSVMFTAYDYGKYGTFNGNKPGFSTSTSYLEAKYDKTFGAWGLLATLTLDKATQQQYQVAGDDIASMGFFVQPNGTDVYIPVLTGAFQNHLWHETTLGAHLQGRFNRKWGEHEMGGLLGTHAVRMQIDDSHYAEGDQFSRILNEWGDQKNLMANHETNIDAYLQMKYKWKNRLILNAGLRYDHKHRYNYQEETHQDIHVLSPRLACILSLPHWAAKLSYSKSFVDAPYFYRNSKLDTSWGGSLEPEYHHSIQASLSTTDIPQGLRAEVNFFYNILKDLVYNNVDLGLYYNGGELKTCGTEVALSYRHKKLRAEANVTWQKLIESENYVTIEGNHLKNIPSIMSNLLIQYELLPSLKLHTHLRLTGRQYTESTINYETYETQIYQLPARAIVNLGANYSHKNWEIGLNVYNLLNTKYVQGGASTSFIRQQGCWWMGDVSYKF